MDLERPGLEIRFSGSGLPMAIGAGPSGITDAKGTIGLQGGVTGTLAAPEPKLRLKSEGAGFSFLPTALRYDPVAIDIGYAPDGVDIDELRIQTNQVWGAKKSSGYFKMTGRVDLGDEGPEQMQLKMKMDEFWLSSTRAASIATSGKVSVDGTFPELDVEGKIKLDDASISVGAEVLKDTSSFEIDESIRVHRTKKKVVARVKEEEEEGPSVADNMSVDLKVDLNSAFRLKADIPMSEDFGAQFAQLAALSMDLGLDGNLHIQQDKAVLSVLGELATLRGEAVAMGKRFHLGGNGHLHGRKLRDLRELLATHRVGQCRAVGSRSRATSRTRPWSWSPGIRPDRCHVDAAVRETDVRHVRDRGRERCRPAQRRHGQRRWAGRTLDRGSIPSERPGGSGLWFGEGGLSHHRQNLPVYRADAS